MGMQEVVVAARRKLLADPGFAALIGTDVGRDNPGDAYRDGWVFKATDDLMNPDRNPRNSGTSAVTIGSPRPWTNPNIHNTLLFRQLSFRILSDSTRGSDPSLMIAQDADYRCDRVATEIRRVFNDVGNNDHFWPNGVYIVSSVLWNDLTIEYMDKEDGLVSGEISFSLELG